MQQKVALERQIDLQVVQAWYNLEAAQKKHTQAQSATRAAQEAFKLVQKRYRQGQANMVQFKDAQTQWTTAQNQEIIARFDYWIALAELERSSAAYPVN